MKTKELTATTFRILLIVSLVVIAALGVGGFILAKNQLTTVATEVSSAVSEANASSNNLETLQLLKRELSKQQEVIARTGQIVAESQSYRYQDQIIADLTKYASEANIVITNIDFGDAGQTPGATTPASSSAGATPTPTTNAAPAPSGVKSTLVSITLNNPVNYNDLLRFVRLIEQNLTKMQVSSIGLSSDATTSQVSSDALTIEVYVR